MVGCSGSRMEQSGREHFDTAIWTARLRCVILIAPLLCGVVCASASFVLIKNIYDSYETRILPPTALITLLVTESDSLLRSYYVVTIACKIFAQKLILSTLLRRKQMQDNNIHAYV